MQIQWFSWESLAVVLALLYLLLAVRCSIWCWPAALFSTLIYMVIFFQARLYMESALQVFYVVMAGYGWWQWRHGGANHGDLPISKLAWQDHLKLIAAIIVGTAVFGWVMSNTQAALPWLDAFTTVAAVVATWMVARKVFENWYYWLVIDMTSIYLYLSRDLQLTALLFGAYIVLIGIGIFSWQRAYQQQSQGSVGA
jgi:nicotinamide mononucleotide transporter